MPLPSIELWLELEPRCNLACRFCYNFWKDGSAPEPRAHSHNATVAALRRLFEAVPITQVAFSGGEPLLRPDLADLARIATGYGARSAVTTNGTLLTRERIHELLEAGIGTFQVSLHSHLPHVHDYLSGGPAWRGAIAAMIRVRESGCLLVPTFVATGVNLWHFPPVLRLLGQLGVTRTIFNRFIPTGLGTLYRDEIGVPGEAQLIAMLSEADNVAHAEGIHVQLGAPIEVPDEVSWRNVSLASCPVHSGQRRWTLSSDLNLRRCNQSGANVGTVFGEGLDRLLSDLIHAENHSHAGFRSCSHLAANRLVTLHA